MNLTLANLLTDSLPAMWSTLAQAAGVAGDSASEALGIGLRHYLTVSALVFSLGLMVIVMRRNAIAVLMGIELMLNAAGLNFVAFAKYVVKDPIDGQVVTLFLIVLAAAEAALALGIVLNIFNNTNSIDVDEFDALKG
jgi:NADH-quinone oxidoreductase subunit K